MSKIRKKWKIRKCTNCKWRQVKGSGTKCVYCRLKSGEMVMPIGKQRNRKIG